MPKGLVVHAAFTASVATMLTGIAIIGLHFWRKGLIVLGAGVVAAAVFRALLPPRLAGLLAVRGRMVDTVLLGVMAAAVLVLASVVPG